MAKEESFGRKIVLRAWFAAWQFFESKTRDAILFVVLFGTGGLVYFRFYGWPATKEQIVPVLIFTVGPIVVLWLLLFVWHMWLAPAALVYEAIKDSIREPISAPSSGLVPASDQPLQELQPPQEQLLKLVAKYQREFAANKLVIGRQDGGLYFKDQNRGKGINLMMELFGQNSETKLENLMDSMPEEYLRTYSEFRLGSPYVVSITQTGQRYLREHQL